MIEELEKRIAYTFEDKKLLETALTHPSLAGHENYERLEFLGDAVLELAVSDALYAGNGRMGEGMMTKRRAEIVCAKSLADAAKKIGLGKYLRLGNGEEQSGGREKQSILANAIEAVFGAVYLDGGFYCAKAVISSIFHDMVFIGDALAGGTDYKTTLQEMVQSTVKKDINYLVSGKEGPPHRTTFYVRLIVGGDVICEGIGSSKKEAEQHAAKFAIEHFDKIYEG